MLYLSKYFAICELIFNWMFWSFNIILIMIVFFSKSYNSNLRGTEETLLQNNPLCIKESYITHFIQKKSRKI